MARSARGEGPPARRRGYPKESVDNSAPKCHFPPVNREGNRTRGPPRGERPWGRGAPEFAPCSSISRAPFTPVFVDFPCSVRPRGADCLAYQTGSFL